MSAVLRRSARFRRINRRLLFRSGQRQERDHERDPDERCTEGGPQRDLPFLAYMYADALVHGSRL